MLSILVLGFLLGMQHALEADHLAAVSSISVGEDSIIKIITHGAIWGAGHTITLMIFAGGTVLLGLQFSESMSGVLEFIVGIMLVYLGISVLKGILKNKVHIHLHHHDDYRFPHFHAHTHESAKHEADPHKHVHPERIPLKTLFIGMTHGLAGSSALVVLVASTSQTPLMGLGYVALFGVGSIIGMASLSAVIAVPFLEISTKFSRLSSISLRSVIGFGTVLLGLQIVYENGVFLFNLT